MIHLTVSQAATELSVSSRRVLALIASGRIKAQRAGERVWLIRPRDLEAVRVRIAGRPKAQV